MRHAALTLVAATMLAAAPLPAQVPPDSGRATVTGTVYDSLAGGPLAGARVQLVARSGDTQGTVRAAVTDARGDFTVAGVPGGTYALGFLHPVLDSLGVEPPVRELLLMAPGVVRADLAVPSATRLRQVVCGTTGDTGQALLMGIVRRADDHVAVTGAIVDAIWLEYELRPEEISSRRVLLSDTTAANGWFALCDVPRGGSLVLRAALAADSTALVETGIPATGFLRRDLYLGSGRAHAVRTVAADAGPGATADSGVMQILVGDGRLSGRAIAHPGGRPLADARVGIIGGPQTRTDAHGAWTLVGIPSGTRLLEVRAVGYYPARVAVDVTPGARPVEVALTTFRAVLDTVRVRASRFRLASTGFDERRRTGLGRYVTPEDLLRRNVVFTTDVFRTMPGLRVDRVAPWGDKVLTMRSAFGRCAPAVFLDGLWLSALSPDDIDSFVDPADIAGIEIYTETTTPPQFQGPMSGCGSLVIWTKPSSNPARRWSYRRRTFHGLAAIAIGIGTGVLLNRH